MSSESVCEWSYTPCSIKEALNYEKLSKVPLWQSMMRLCWSKWGWEFSSVFPPQVAQRVCPIPI